MLFRSCPPFNLFFATGRSHFYYKLNGVIPQVLTAEAFFEPPDYLGVFLYKKRTFESSNVLPSLIRFESVCKPSSVVYGHLSRLTVTSKLKRYSRCSVGRTALLTETQSCSEWGLHGIPCYQDIGELLPRLSILTANGQACCQAVQNRS